MHRNNVITYLSADFVLFLRWLLGPAPLLFPPEERTWCSSPRETSGCLHECQSCSWGCCSQRRWQNKKNESWWRTLQWRVNTEDKNVSVTWCCGFVSWADLILLTVWRCFQPFRWRLHFESSKHRRISEDNMLSTVWYEVTMHIWVWILARPSCKAPI